MKNYPFIKTTIAFIIGILASNIFQFNIKYIAIILFLSISLIIIIISKNFHFRYSKIISSTFLFLLIFSFGFFIANQNQTKIISPLSEYQKEKNSQLYAQVIDVELKRSFEIVFTVKTDSILIDNKIIVTDDKLICKFRGDDEQRKYIYDKINSGNNICLTGTYQKGRERRNPGEFDYDKYLKQNGITGLFISYDADSISILNSEKDIFNSTVHSVRKTIDKIIHDLQDQQTGGLLRGLILADRSEIDYETKNEFINSGTVHILAVSGLHVGYVLVIFIFIFGRFGIYLRSTLTILGLLGFMFLTGAPPSVFRATLMAIVIIIAFLSNRTTNIINSISIAAFIILLINPNEIYNPGFQLSFSAVLAIGILYPYFQRNIYKLHLKQKWIEYILLFFGVSLCAQIGTLPFTLAYFSKLSVIALLANLIVIPAVGVIIGIAFITIFIGLFSYSIAIFFAATNDLISGLMIDFIRFTGRLDFSFLWIRNYSLYDSIIFYTGLALILFVIQKSNKRLLKIALPILIILSMIIITTFDNKELLTKNKLSVFMIDVGQGDTFLIKFPNGKTALIDAGEANPFIDNGERVIIPLLDYLGINKIDYGFISHLDLDHYGGFVSLIYQTKINKIFRPLPDSSEKSVRFEKFLMEKKVKADIYDRKSFYVGNTKIYFLNDPESFSYKSFSSNDKSGVLKIVFGKTSFLFVGDCEHPAEYFLASNFREMLDSDVLKVGHHGSSTGSSIAFLNLVSPKISLVSAGIKNKFKHPSEEVINSLENINSKIYRTDQMGAILLQSDGQNIKQVNWK
ncbi:MAG: DNA internalization-related competence protein ComEC/Rec2 [Ignavibacteriales bacterium]|nr:DNA internalization-related competence protein ComEC/Rec2 [Ignavibacteriales bacterium]